MIRAWMRGSLTAAAAVAAGLAVGVPAASAGSYDVYACTIDGGVFPNNSWARANNPDPDARYVTDAACPAANDPLVVALAAGNAFDPGTYAGLLFSAPGGAHISDYALRVRQYWYAPGYLDSNGVRRPSETTYNVINVLTPAIGSAPARNVIISGEGQYEPAQQRGLAAEGHWYGYDPATGASHFGDTGLITVTRAGSRVAQGETQPTVMSVSVGCWVSSGGCSLGNDPGGTASVYAALYGARVTVSDDSPPSLAGPSPGQGLLAPGTRSGSESVTFSASDNVGLRRAELVDVTDAADPRVVAAKDYNAGTLTAQRTRCDFTVPRPCPDLKDESLAADPPIAGHRTVLVRVTDAAGNQTVSSPTAIYARGSVNGAGGGDGAKLTAGFPAKVYRRSKAGKRYYTYVIRPSRTVSYGKGAALRGILRNAAGQPIAGAQLRILVREARLGAQYVDRGAVSTGADGRFTLGVPAGSSRTYQLAYKAYVGDDGLAARSKSTLNVRARITAHAPRRVRGRGAARFHGTLVGHPLPRRGVTLELQAFQPRRGWRTVGTTRTHKRGRYAIRYRFNSPRGRFTFRVRLRPNDAYPYARGTSPRMRVRVG